MSAAPTPDDAGVPRQQRRGDPGPDHVSPAQGSGSHFGLVPIAATVLASSGAASAVARRLAAAGPTAASTRPGIIPLRPLQVR